MVPLPPSRSPRPGRGVQPGAAPRLADATLRHGTGHASVVIVAATRWGSPAAGPDGATAALRGTVSLEAIWAAYQLSGFHSLVPSVSTISGGNWARSTSLLHPWSWSSE